MNPPPDLAVERAARDILAYFQACPQASDSAVGVGLWLERGGSPRAARVVERALALLVERGQVQALDLAPGGVTIYRMPPRDLSADSS